MPDATPPDARVSSAAARNRGPILETLRPHLPGTGLVLEIAAGSGEHAVHLATALPHLCWLPTDADPDAMASIGAWRTLAGLPNLMEPVRLDAADRAPWPVERVDAVVCINMVHIAPWRATEGLVAGAAGVLVTGGLLFLYGPFLERGVETAPSNLAFDLSLKDRDPEWGLRPLERVSALCRRHGLTAQARTAMPANNLALVYRKTSLAPAGTDHGSG